MQASTRADPTVIFLHIPKAAGSTLHSVLERMYPQESTFNVPGPHSAWEEQLSRMDVTERARLRLIKGHLLFGLHRMLPGPSTYITVLRHPVERVISHYYFVKRRPRHRLHSIVLERTLEEYVAEGTSLELNNGQVRALFGPGHLVVPYGRCDHSMLDVAQDNLKRHFSVVGITERFDETLLWMMRRLGWNRMPFYLARNVTRNRPAVERVPEHVLSKIEQANELDLVLYENACRNFDRAVEEAGLSDDLERFQCWNGVYDRCASPLTALRAKLVKIKRYRTPVTNG